MKSVTVSVLLFLLFEGCSLITPTPNANVSEINGEEISGISVVITQEMIDEYKMHHKK